MAQSLMPLSTRQRVASDGTHFSTSHFAEPFDIVFAESNYIGTADKSRGTAKYHQHYDITESVTVVSFACSAEIGH